MSAQPGNSIQDLYEGDQSKLYSGVAAHHDPDGITSKASKKQVGRIWKVTGILTVVTIAEVMLGMYSHGHVAKWLVNTMFLLLTVFKAGYIVSVFMHLGDEVRSFLIAVMIPLTLFIWFIIAFLADGTFWLHMNVSVGTARP